jgi:hypothetical protein
MNWLLCNERISLFIKFCYQGIMSTLTLVTRNDVIVYDVDVALLLMVFVCIGNVLHTVTMIESMEKTYNDATKLAEEQVRNSLLLKVFLNARTQGKLKEIVAMKQKYNSVY